ncbi:LytR C-terminal domain-containing protein [Flexivirga alba]|uniref:LytR C-terminal domain-containing protein n=1 Tax=Flexivirga alba TaxID=702742 RepID=A0ABW2AC29_9MICO
MAGATVVIALTLPAIAACNSTNAGHPTSESCVGAETVPTMKIALNSIHANIWNADGKTGQAASVATQLSWRGIKIIATGNDPKGGTAPKYAQIRYGPNGKQIALTLAQQVKGATLEQDNRADPSVDLVIGAKFALVPVPPPAPSKITVNVYNAYVLPGTAATLGTELHKRGFKVAAVGNDPKRGYYPDNAVAIRYGAQGEPAARRAALQFKNVKMIQDGRKSTTVDVVIGSKWVDSSIVPVAQATPAPTPKPTSSSCAATASTSGGSATSS